ncbi:MAG: VOC family protein [Chloroflexi bacterium]|nr:VOC family protein [Chloroflexota bacterium]
MAGIKRVDHIGFAVRNLASTLATLEKLYGGRVIRQCELPAHECVVAYVLVGSSVLTVLESTTPDGPIAKFIEERGEGIEHVALEVDDLDATVEELAGNGVSVFGKSDGELRRDAMVGPENAFGTFFELIQWMGPCRGASTEERIKLYVGE